MISITLGNTVVVSDPCYEIPTWCQAVVENVLPGNYRTTVLKTDDNDWGTRCSHIISIHEDYCTQDQKFKWESYPADIGVDSGQAGIFSIESYRKDDYQFNFEPYSFGQNYDTQDGDKWYRHMCELTLGSEQWGSYDNGVVSSSGIGDGSYELLITKKKGLIIGFVINFFMDKRSIKKIIQEEFQTRI